MKTEHIPPSVTPLLECRSDLRQTLIRRPWPDALIPRQSNLMRLSCLGILDLRLDWHDLIVDPSFLLRPLGLLIRRSRKSILTFSGHVEIASNILARLAHGLQTILGLTLAHHQLLGELETQAAATSRHKLGSDGEADVDASKMDLVGNVLDGFEAGGTEAVDGGGGGSVGEAGCERGGTDEVRRAGVVDLHEVSLASGLTCLGEVGEWHGTVQGIRAVPRGGTFTYVTDTDVFDNLRVDLALVQHLHHNLI
jgi:hypothetical protein